jgi:hypothetical protein
MLKYNITQIKLDAVVIVKRILKPSAHFIISGQKEELNEDSKCSFKIDWMKSVLSLNIIHENPSYTLHRIPGFQIFQVYSVSKDGRECVNVNFLEGAINKCTQKKRAFLGYAKILLRLVVLMVVSGQVTVFWDVTLCSVVNRYKCFTRTFCLHLQVEEEATGFFRMLVAV